MTNYQMVTFVGGVKKHIVKGVTFIDGQKKVLWQTGNYALNSWQLSELQYPNNLATPVGLYADKTRLVYTCGEYVTRNNISNISAPTVENCVKNGGASSWDALKQTGTLEVFYATYQFYPSSGGGSSTPGVSVSTSPITAFNEIQLDTSTMSVVVGQSGQAGSSAMNNGTYTHSDTYGWISVVPDSGCYKVYTGDTVLVTIATNGYSGTSKPSVSKMVIQSDGYILMSYEYQATSGGDYTYGIKRINLSTGVATDVASGLTSPVTAIMVDGNRFVYTAGDQMVEKSAAGATTYHTYSGYNSGRPLTLIGRIGSYYYVGSTVAAASGGTQYMNIEIVAKSSFARFEYHDTEIRAMTFNVAPYISNNKYLCFGTWHGIAHTYYTGSVGGGGRTPTIRPGGYVTTYTEVEYRVNRIQGY